MNLYHNLNYHTFFTNPLVSRIRLDDNHKLYEEKFKITKDDIKIPDKEISNTNLSYQYERQILKYATEFFK